MIFLDNTAGVIELLCSKFGTTMDNLLPAVIEFGKYDCRLTARICSYFIIAGIFMIIFGRFIEKHSYDGLFCEIIGIMIFVLGILAIIIASFILVIALATLNEWNNYPEVMAYKYILNQLR